LLLSSLDKTVAASPPSQAVRRAAYPMASFVKNVGIDHGCTDVLVAKQFLNRLNVVSIFNQMGG